MSMSGPPEPQTPRPQHRKHSKPNFRDQLLFVAGICLLAAAAFYSALVVATQVDEIFFPGNEIRLGGLSSLPGIDDGEPEAVSGGRINILVMGLDRRPHEGEAPARTDTMFVLTIDASTRTARGLAIPRDLLVEIPTPNGSFSDRINAAYVLGETRGYPGGGIGTVTATVEDLLGIKVDHYVLVDFEGFKQVVDLLGGIDVDVPPPGVNDPTYSETELLGDFYPCVFEPGTYHMDGSQALCYARVRRNSNDLDRILRQQRIIFAVMDKATQLNVLADPTNVVSLWQRYKNTITTDINDLQIPGFARLAAAIDPDQMAFLSLGPATTPFTTAEGAAVLLPSEEGIRQIVEAFLADNRLLQEGALVEVQNRTGQSGQAAEAVEYFISLGLPESSLITVTTSLDDQPNTEIIDFTGKSYTAQLLASWLGIPQAQIRSSTAEDESIRSSSADILVILGADAKIAIAIVAP